MEMLPNGVLWGMIGTGRGIAVSSATQRSLFDSGATGDIVFQSHW